MSSYQQYSDGGDDDIIVTILVGFVIFIMLCGLGLIIFLCFYFNVPKKAKKKAFGDPKNALPDDVPLEECPINIGEVDVEIENIVKESSKKGKKKSKSKRERSRSRRERSKSKSKSKSKSISKSKDEEDAEFA